MLESIFRYFAFFKFIFLALIGLGAFGTAYAERIVAHSSDGVIRMKLDARCNGATCGWMDIDKDMRAVSLAATANWIYKLRADGSIWQWQNQPCFANQCTGWKRVSEAAPVREIVANDNRLFRLHTNGEIHATSDRSCPTGSGSISGRTCNLIWQRLDRNPSTVKISAAGSKLFQMHRDGKIWHWKGRACSGNSCPSWELIDRNPSTRGITYGARGRLYQYHANGNIWQWQGRACEGGTCASWTRIGRDESLQELRSVGGLLYRVRDTGRIYRWKGGACRNWDDSCASNWDLLGILPGSFQIAAGRNAPVNEFDPSASTSSILLALTENGTVLRWHGSICRTQFCGNWADEGRDAFSSYNGRKGGLYVFEGVPPDRQDEQFSSHTTIPAFIGDQDGDGLPDSWEEERASWGLRTDTANMIVVAVERPNLTDNTAFMTDLSDNLEKVKSFFARMPVKTKQGRNGIHVVFRDGNSLDDKYADDLDDGDAQGDPIDVINYREAYSDAMPSDLKGYAHGLLIGRSGGGQTSSSYWAGVSKDWRTIVHELGHQLGLGHTPPNPLGVSAQSPLYASLMNYDYNYTFAGSGRNIQFSRGKFRTFGFDEKRLNENLPFSYSDLSFLRYDPYNFAIRSIDTVSSSVDWNRNGIFGETNVKADINNGYAHGVGLFNHVGKTTGDLALTSKGNILVSFNTKVQGFPVTSDTVVSNQATPDEPGRIDYNSVRVRVKLKSGTLTGAADVTGPPSAVTVNGQVILAFPGTNGFLQIGVYDVSSDGELTGSLSRVPTNGRREVALVKTTKKNIVHAILRNPDNGQLEIARIQIFNGRTNLIEQTLITFEDGTALTSNVIPAAVFDTRRARILVLSTETTGLNEDRLNLWTLEPYTSRARPIKGQASNPFALPSVQRYRATTPHWLGGSTVRTLHRPAMVYENVAPDGRLFVIYRQINSTDNSLANMRFVKVNLNSTTSSPSPFLMVDKFFINEWVRSRNGVALTPYLSDFAVAWRIPEVSADGDEKPAETRNLVEINLDASGEFSKGPADFDDVYWIATKGLRRIVEGR